MSPRRLVAIATLAAACSGGTATAPGARWHDWDEYVYRVELSSRATIPSARAPMTFDLTGRLVLRARSSEASTSFLASMHHVDVRSTGDAHAFLPPGLARELEFPWGFEIVAGRAASLRVRAEPQPFTVAVLSTLAAAFQHPTGPAAGGAFTASETDGSGPYHARYASGGERGRWTKKKLGYEGVPSRAAPGPPPAQASAIPRVVASSGELRFDGDDLVALGSHEEMDVVVTGASRVRSTVDLALTLVEHRRGAAAPDWQSLSASTVVLPMGGRTASDEPACAFDASRAADVRFADVLGRLEGESALLGPATASHGSVPDMAAVREQGLTFGTAVALLRTHPEAVEQAVVAIERGSRARRWLLDALGSAGTPEAQAALVRKMRDRHAREEVRRDAAFALLRTPRPTAPSIDALVDALGDPLVRAHAVEGLATCAHRLSDAGELELSRRAADGLVGALATATRSSDRVEILRGIANSGDGRSFETVRPLADDADASVREAAVSAIRLMPHPAVDELLARRLAVNEDPGVRLAALDAAALRFPKAPLIGAVRDVAIGAPDSQSRAVAVRLLERWSAGRPELHRAPQRWAGRAAHEGRGAEVAALER